MTRLLFLLPVLLLGACETHSDPYAPVRNVRYTAIGHDPFWLVTIGDDRIVLRLGHDGGEEAGEHDDIVYPRTLPRTVDGVRIWQSGEGTRVIAIEARPGPCGNHEHRYEDHVRVRFGGRELTGCGGRLLGRAREP